MAGDRFFPSVVDQKSSLRVQSSEVGDAGKYSVVAGGAESSTVLEVRQKPAIAKTEKELLFDALDSVIVTVPFASTTEPEVEWLFNGVKVPVEARTETEVYNQRAKLIRRKASKHDSGEYKVKVANEAGDCEAVFRVTVRGMITFCATDY